MIVQIFAWRTFESRHHAPSCLASERNLSGAIRCGPCVCFFQLPDQQSLRRLVIVAGLNDVVTEISTRVGGVR